MQQRALALALFAAGAALPAANPAAAQDCTQIFVYSVNQVCRTLSNGFSQCQPVGMVGPAPNCAQPGVPPLMAVPLAPPMTQAPPAFAFQPPFPGPAMPAVPAPVAAAPAMPAAAAPAVAPAPKPVPAPATAAVPVAAPASAAAPVKPEARPAPAAEAPKPALQATPAAQAPGVPVPQAAAPAKVEAVPVARPVPVPAEPTQVVTQAVAPAPTPSAAKAEAVAAPAAPAPSPVITAAPAAKPTAPYPAQLVLQDGVAHFDFDRAELSEKARAELDAWLKHPLPQGKALRVTGHADRLGPAPYNMKLSGRRALTVKKYLEGKGVAGKDIKVVAKGEGDPIKHCAGGATKATIACLAPNRRVEIDPE